MMSLGGNRPLVALRALFSLARNPDDLPTVFTLIRALPGRNPARLLERMCASTNGQRLIATRPNLGARLADRATLLALPAGTLGRAYAEMAERTGITPQGIVDASVEGAERDLAESEESRFVGERMRDTHDLWHVVTGYGVDVLGELALLSFIFAQTRHPGIGLIVGFAFVNFVPTVNPILKEAHRRGVAAVWLPAVVWEELLDKPLDEVRARLRVGAPPVYAPITTASLRASGRIPSAA